MTVSAGRLEWDLDIARQEEALQKVTDLGRKLDQALNRRPAGRTALTQVAQEATSASDRVGRLSERFRQLQGQFRLGQVDTATYARRLEQLRQGAERTGRQAGLTASEYAKLGNLMKQAAREQATLGGASQDLVQRQRLLIAEVRVLRSEWQRTGQGTTETKNRLNALQVEMAELTAEMRKADGGFQRYGQNIAQISTWMRSAEATVAGMEGRMSRLGLASQVNLATQQALVGQLYRFGPAGQVAAGSLGIVGATMGTLSVSTLGVVGALVGVGVAASSLTRTGIPEVKQMQAALQVLRASGEDLDRTGLDRILRDAQEAAGEAGKQFARSQIATALAEIVKAGVDAANAVNLLAPGMQIASITGESLNDATTRLLANLRQFGLPATAAARAADALAAADFAAARGAKELSEGLAVVGPVARAAGFELEDTLGILVELDNKGLNPADVGATALRGTLAALLDPTKEARDALERLGVQLEDQGGKSRPLLDVLMELQEAMNGNSEAAQEAAKIFDTRAITAILNMTDASSELAEKLRNSQGAAEKMAETLAQEDLVKAQERLATAWKDIAGTFSGRFASDLTTITSTVADFLRMLDRFMQKYPERPWWAKGNSLAFIQPFFAGDEPVDDGVSYRSVTATGGSATSGGGSAGGRSGGIIGATAGSMEDLINQARELKRALDAATTPQAWLAANRAVDQFRATSEAAAEAWQAVVSTISGTGSATPGAASRTVGNVFQDLERAGVQAERRAAAFGNTLEAQADSVRTRMGLVNRGIDELFSMGLTAADDKVTYLVGRLEDLATEAALLERLVRNQSLSTGGIAALPGGEPRVSAPRFGAGEFMGPESFTAADQTAREKALEDLNAFIDAIDKYGQAITGVQRDLDAGSITKQEALAASLKATEKAIDTLAPLYDRLGAEQRAYVDRLVVDAADLRRQVSLIDAEAERAARNAERRINDQERRGDDTTPAATLSQEELAQILADARARQQAREDADRQVRDEARKRLNAARAETFATQRSARDLGRAVAEAIRDGSIEGLVDLEAQILAALDTIGDDPSAAPLLGLLTRVREGIDTLTESSEEAERALQRVTALMTSPTRIAAMERAEVGGPGAGMASGFATPEEQAAWVRNHRDAAESVEALQRRIIALRNMGVEPTAEAIQVLVRRINELQLKAALQELQEEGLDGLSDFAREVLRLNGILPGATTDAQDFTQALVAMGGNDIAQGLGSVIEGIRMIAKEGDDAWKVVEGLTLALEGVNQIIEGLTSGDAFEVVKNLAMVVGEGIGRALGVPGVGPLVGAVFDFGRAISDSITGDSPAARALRESLTNTVRSAFTTGILAALRGEEGWQDALRTNVRVAFLTALIEAFVKSAIVGAFIEPLLVEYSKMIAKGQYAAAADFLNSQLPGAIDKSIRAAEDFVAAIPPGLLPGTGSGGDTGGGDEPGVFELPTATVTALAAPAWARDLVNAATIQREAAQRFADAVEVLTSRGVTVNPGRPGGNGGAAAARAA